MGTNRAEKLIAEAESSFSPVGMYRGLFKQLCAELEDTTSAEGLPYAIRALGQLKYDQAIELLSAVEALFEAQTLDYSEIVGHLQEARGAASLVNEPSAEEVLEAAEWQRADAWIDERKEARAA